MKNGTALLFTIITALASCSSSKDCYYIESSNGTNYSIDTSNTTTPNGINVDMSGMPVHLETIDQMVDDLEICLRSVLHNPNFTIDRSCLRVKIAPDWFYAPCPNHAEIFPCDIEASRCSGSFMSPAEAHKHAMCIQTPEFDPSRCYCAGVVQDTDIAVVPPSLQALRHELTHIIMKVYDPIPAEFNQCIEGVTTCPY